MRLLAEEGGNGGGELPDTVQGLLAARLDSLEPFERRLVQHAAVVGRTFWQESLGAGRRARRGATSTQALSALQEKDIFVPGEGTRARRRARAGVQARADPRRGLRDAAQGGPRRASTSRSAASSRSAPGDRGRRGRGAARRALRPRRGARPRGAAWTPTSSSAPSCKALHFLEAAGDAALSFYSNSEAFAHYQAARELGQRHDAEALARIGEKQGDAALRLGRVDAAIEVWQECLEYHRRNENLTRRRRPAPQDRLGLLAQGRAPRGDRAPPEGHQPAEGRRRPASSSCASTRRRPGSTCRRATTCSRSTPPRRRCGWPSGSARRARQAAPTASSAACSAASATR